MAKRRGNIYRAVFVCRMVNKVGTGSRKAPLQGMGVFNNVFGWVYFPKFIVVSIFRLSNKI